MRLAIPGLVLILAVLAPPAVHAETPPAPAYRVVDVIADLVAYHTACADADASTRAARWTTMVEAKHAAFFRDVIYRGYEGDRRTDHVRHCVETFWKTHAPNMKTIAKRAKALEPRLHAVAKRFRAAFPDADLATDVFLTVSFSFKGKVQEVDGENVLALGVEMFEDAGAQADITIAHELFHLHHAAAFPRRGALYRALWSEGLATYASAQVVPGHRRSAYLGFPADKMNLCDRLLPELAADLDRHAGENDQRRKRLYFGAETNETRVPPESGYYVGLLLVENVARSVPVAKLAALPPKEVFPLVRKELAKLAVSRR